LVVEDLLEDIDDIDEDEDLRQYPATLVPLVLV